MNDVFLPVILIAAGVPGWAESDPAAADFLAEAVRESGHVCVDPEDAERDWVRSGNGVKAWRLRCGDDSFDVRIPDDRAPEVERSFGD